MRQAAALRTQARTKRVQARRLRVKEVNRDLVVSARQRARDAASFLDYRLNMIEPINETFTAIAELQKAGLIVNGYTREIKEISDAFTQLLNRFRHMLNDMGDIQG